MSKKQTVNGGLLPRDDNSVPIQVLSPVIGGTKHRTVIEASSARVELTSEPGIVRIASDVAMWLAFGDSSVVAGDTLPDSMLFPAGAEVYHLRETVFTYMAVRSLSGEGSGVVTATKME